MLNIASGLPDAGIRLDLNEILVQMRELLKAAAEVPEKRRMELIEALERVGYCDKMQNPEARFRT